MKHLFCIAAFIAVSIYVHAKKVPGTIVSKGKSRDVTFEIKEMWLDDEPNFESIQRRIRYYDEGGKKQTLRPGDADEVTFIFNNETIRMISSGNTQDCGLALSTYSQLFLRLITDGPLRLYRFYYTQNQGGGFGTGGMHYSPGYPVDNYVFQKSNGALFQPESLRWKKDI